MSSVFEYREATEKSLETENHRLYNVPNILRFIRKNKVDDGF